MGISRVGVSLSSDCLEREEEIGNNIIHELV